MPGVETIEQKMSKVSTKAVVHKVRNLTLRYTLSEIICPSSSGHKKKSVLHLLLLGVAQLAWLDTGHNVTARDFLTNCT